MISWWFEWFGSPTPNPNSYQALLGPMRYVFLATGGNPTCTLLAFLTNQCLLICGSDCLYYITCFTKHPSCNYQSSWEWLGLQLDWLQDCFHDMDKHMMHTCTQHCARINCKVHCFSYGKGCKTCLLPPMKARSHVEIEDVEDSR